MYGWRGRSNNSSTTACSATRAAYMTTTSSATSATTPRSCVIMITAVPCSSCSSRISSRICAWVVTSSAVVGSSAIKQLGVVDQRHRDHDALPHAARELMRIVVDAARRPWNPDLDEPGDCAVARLTRRDVAVQLDRLDELVADRAHRIERRHRILEDHRDLAAANVTKARAGRAEQVLAAEERLPRRDRQVLLRPLEIRRHRGARVGAGRDLQLPGFALSLMIDIIVTLLPQPDSPTTPSVWPARTLNETPSTARTMPSSVLK